MSGNIKFDFWELNTKIIKRGKIYIFMIIQEIFSDFAIFVPNHPYLSTLIAAFFSEELLVFLSILSGRGMINFWIVYFFSIIGLLIFDSVIFALGKTGLGRHIEERFFPKRKMEEKIRFANTKKRLFYLIVTKFVWGTRIPSLFYFSASGMHYSKFVKYNLISLFIWASIMLTSGWFAGKGFHKLLNLTQGFEKFIAILFLAVIIFFLVNQIVRKILQKESKYLT